MHVSDLTNVNHTSDGKVVVDREQSSIELSGPNAKRSKKRLSKSGGNDKSIKSAAVAPAQDSSQDGEDEGI